MEEQEERKEKEDEIVEIQDGHVKGCRGRVLVALIVVVLMFLLLLVMLFRGMMTTPPPQPKQASAVDLPTSPASANTRFVTASPPKDERQPSSCRRGAS